MSEFALIPVGIVGLYRLIRSGSFALMDLLVLLYAASIGLSEILHAAVLNDGIFSAVDAFISIFLAYAAGRKLIEPDLRLATVRRFVTLVLLDGPSGLWEWRMGQSPYGIFASKSSRARDHGEGTHLRNGRGRMGTVFGGGELAGIAFAITFCLNAWLVYLRRVKASVDLGKILTRLEKYHVPGLLLLLYVWLTQSRGPLIALGAGYLILQIPRFKYTRMMTLLVAVLLIGGYMAMSAYFASYTNAPAATTMNEQQTSVLYRKEMNELYAPIAEKGGWTGYGVLGIPSVQGMTSIDNQYLLVHLAWGRLGLLPLYTHRLGKHTRPVGAFMAARGFAGPCLHFFHVGRDGGSLVYASDGIFGGTAATDRFSPDRLDTIDGTAGKSEGSPSGESSVSLEPTSRSRSGGC